MTSVTLIARTAEMIFASWGVFMLLLVVAVRIDWFDRWLDRSRARAMLVCGGAAGILTALLWALVR